LPWASSPTLTLRSSIGGDGDGLASERDTSTTREEEPRYDVHHSQQRLRFDEGQASPTLKRDLKTKLLPRPNINEGTRLGWR
jgi:hypothetical protein